MAQQSDRATEETPLLAREEPYINDDVHESNTSETPSSVNSAAPGKIPIAGRCPSLAALVVLFGAILVIMMSGFLVPTAMKEYASQAIDFRPTRFYPENFTDSGAVLRVEGVLTLDASRVKRQSVRNVGRLVTWIAKEVEVGPSEIQVFLPTYKDALAGVAKLPKVNIDVRDAHENKIDTHAELSPGTYEGLKEVANDLLNGQLRNLLVLAEVEVELKSGLINLGRRNLRQIVELKSEQAPSFPDYTISRLDVQEYLPPNHPGSLRVDLQLAIQNKYSLGLSVPSLTFEIMVPNCATGDPPILVGTASSQKIHIKPELDIEVGVLGKIGQLSPSLTSLCPDSHKSPLDALVRDYINGFDTVFWVKCTGFTGFHTPGWARDLMQSIAVPIPLPGHDFQHLLKSFSLSDVHLRLPEGSDEPESPEARPRISAKVLAVVDYPQGIKFAPNVTQVAAMANVYYKERKLGELDLSKWQEATSTRNSSHSGQDSVLLVESSVQDAPLEVTDGEVLGAVIQKLLFEKEDVHLLVEAKVDVALKTPVGQFVVREIPANGTIPIAPPLSGPINNLAPEVGELQITDTDKHSITLQAKVNFTNPTAYTLTAPFVDLKLLSNETIIGHAVVEDCTITPGNNTNISVKAIYDPSVEGGQRGVDSGRKLLSDYVSGLNTTITIKAHNGTIPSLPIIGDALSSFSVDLPAPRLKPPHNPDQDDGDGDDEESSPHFIKEATMHLLSSTAIFTLESPLTTTTLYLTSINATAMYHQSTVGKIVYDLPFAVPPGISETPRLPVDWSLGSVGYEAVRKALGGQLRLNATATIGVRIGEWEEQIWFIGHGIGAKVGL